MATLVDTLDRIVEVMNIMADNHQRLCSRVDTLEQEKQNLSKDVNQLKSDVEELISRLKNHDHIDIADGYKQIIFYTKV